MQAVEEENKCVQLASVSGQVLVGADAAFYLNDKFTNEAL